MTPEYMHVYQFVEWLMTEVTDSARGNRFDELDVAPVGRFWLGRLAPEEAVRANPLGDRAERLDPCAIGIRAQPDTFDGRRIDCRVRLAAWLQVNDPDKPDIRWRKTNYIDVNVNIIMPSEFGERFTGGKDEIASALTDVGAEGLSAEICAEIEIGRYGEELVLTLVNTSPLEQPGIDTNLYEVTFEVNIGTTTPFILENLPDSFRYDRTIPAYGVNCGVSVSQPGVFVTTDYSTSDQMRPVYWDTELLGDPPELSFLKLSQEPESTLQIMVNDLEKWVDVMWSKKEIKKRGQGEGWDPDTLQLALDESERAGEEVERIRSGISLLTKDKLLYQSFILANKSFERCHEIGSVKHNNWRPFQLGFVLANLSAIHFGTSHEDSEFVDTLWFATGGGKTETYLLLVLIAAFYDRLRGKVEGITSWARFPLRMLSLQQTQRFADIFAAAELIRQEEGIDGNEFSIGFFVGEAGAPNRVNVEPRPGEPDPNDPSSLQKYRILIRCPFCQNEDIKIVFDHSRWALDHVCLNNACPWKGKSLPFRIVDQEIFRFLPTVVVGTLDKAAIVAYQAAMRGFYSAPLGKCPIPHHGFTYAPRSKSPSGCLFPGCRETPVSLIQNKDLYPPCIRMQDELHLLRDSLGSVGAHYEAVLDHLQGLSDSPAKLIASSATLAGYTNQVNVLYRRHPRIFPLPGPWASKSFWSIESKEITRRYVGLAPRGVTLEYANDQLIETLQRAIRRAITEPENVSNESNIPIKCLPELVNLYGVNVVYGSTLKDVEAAARSFESQISLPQVNSATLTGRTPLDEVRSILHRLTKPEANFYDRIHLIAASSMLSHGVDIDRLNVMVMLGLPLSTAEFIQSTARVGRAVPGLVFTLHKIGRERDAAVYRMFRSFIKNMGRLVEPVPITRRSRRVLEKTISGIESARIYGVHEPVAIANGLQQLTLPKRVRRAFTQLQINEDQELQEIITLLGFDGPLEESLRNDLENYIHEFFRALYDPASSAQWVSDLFITGSPMLSFRDVEEQVGVYSRGGRT